MELPTGIALHCIGSMFCWRVFCHCLGVKVKVPWWVHCWWPLQGTIYMLGNCFLSHRPLAERIFSWICHKLDILLFYRPFSGSELLPYANRAWFRYLFSPSKKGKVSMRDLTGCPNLAKCLLCGLTPTASKWALHVYGFPRRGGNLNGPRGSTSPGWKGGAQPLPYFSSKEVVNPAGVSTNLVTWDKALVIYLFFASFFFFGLRGEKNNAWYIHLTSRQLPPNLPNLTSAWPVMLLANRRLPYGNQILARIMSLEINFREKEIFKYVHVQMVLPPQKFKCVVFVMKYCQLELPYLNLLFNSYK